MVFLFAKIATTMKNKDFYDICIDCGANTLTSVTYLPTRTAARMI